MDLYENLIPQLSSTKSWNSSKEAAILEPYSYLAESKGKEFRSKMIAAFNHWLQVPPDRLEVISRVVRMLHTASLLIDDIQDDSKLRRGAPVAHKIYGVPQTINSANYVYFLAFQELRLLSQTAQPPPAGICSESCSENGGCGQWLDQVVTEEILNLHRGQGLELLWRDSLECPTEESYVEMVNNKTGGQFRLAIKLMVSQSKSTVDYIPLVNTLGVLFQIRDDYMNLQSAEYTANKSFAEDLSEGKFSFPIVHSIRADKTNRQVLNVLQKRPSTPTTKSHIIHYMDDHTKSFSYARSVLRLLQGQAREEIKRLGGNEPLEKILDAWVVPEPED